ncbi:trafficking protein particle complex subunit 8-like isoform X2 [Macrobrachium nipponense]|uniref:trafficking protein particle complex subunit 8-like isoform X2 n=1 Tax=Macrobrachium nipponense TaxID=159736 RepID=UPI0030C84FC5
MAQCKLTPPEYIQNAFAPQVAVLCSEDADNLCLKNNLRFVELIQPFCRLNVETRIADPSGNTVPIRNLRVAFEDMNRRPPQPTLGKKLLSEVVGSTPWDRPMTKTVIAPGTRQGLELELQCTTPWFEAWRDMFLHVQYPSDHEFTKHYIACIIVIASTSENPLDQLNRLSQYQHQQHHQTPARFPKWFSPNILKFYLLIHDVAAGDVHRSDQLYEQMTSMYGSVNCHILKINSRQADQGDLHLPDPWSQFLIQRASIDPGGSSSETSSGTGTPREDVSGLPSRVTEGDTTDNCEPIHPLSPVAPPEEEKNGKFDMMPGVEISADVPVLVNRPTLPTGVTQHHGGCLTTQDVDAIRTFVNDFCIKALIPHVERQIRYLNEAVTNRSRSKSLLSATRRWLGGNKSPGSATNSVIYSPEATELQTRRLGDLCFMFGLYELAYSSYHTAKNDFKSDQAWLYFAGAQEMAALAAFMNNSADYPKRYLEGSLQTYLNVCKVYNFAIRATLLSTEVLKYCGDFGEAAMMFIKLTSEESDLLSALMLEQAAHCFINSQRPLPRKYAFHMTLAGHRFSKAGQRAHSLRAYKQAFQVYARRGWVLAEDHIHFTLGKQAHHLKQLSESLGAYSLLVDQRLKEDSPSQQSQSQQMTYVREFMNTFHQYVQQEWDPSTGLPCLPLPIIDSQATKVLLGARQELQNAGWTAASDVSLDIEIGADKRWYALEQELLSVAHNASSFSVFRPNLNLLSNNTPNTVCPFVPVNEPVFVEVFMKNPLTISLMISDVQLIFKFEKTDESENVEVPVKHSTFPGFNIPAGAQETVRLELYPQCIGHLLITGVQYKLGLTPDMLSGSLSSSPPVVIEGQQTIEVRGTRLNTNNVEKCSVVYSKDKRLEVSVVAPLSRLSVAFQNIPGILSCGELFSTDAIITNTGPCAISKLMLAVSDPKSMYMSLEECESPAKNVCVLSSSQMGDMKISGRAKILPLPNGALRSGETIGAKLWLHAPQSSGAFDVELLFYYETEDSPPKTRYRLLRHFSSIYVERSMSIKVTSLVSQNLQETINSTAGGDPTSTGSGNLVVEAHNCSEVDTSCSSFTVIGISANSKKWAVLPHSPLQDQKLGGDESCNVCVQCIPYHTSDVPLVLSQLHFSNNKIPLCSWWRFTLRERMKLLDLLADPPPPNPTADHIPPPPTQAQKDARDMIAADTLDMVVTVLWMGQRNGTQTWGQHSVHLQNLCDSVCVPNLPLIQTGEEEKPPIRIIPEVPLPPIQSPLPPPDKQKHLVKVSANFPSLVEHDFFVSRLCSIKFELHLQNCSACCLVTHLNLSPECLSVSTGNSSNHMYSPQSSTQVLYVGGTVRKITLQPWEFSKVPVCALVTLPGTYSLGTFSLTALRRHADSSEAPVPQMCQLQTAVVVRESNSKVSHHHHSHNS